MQWDVRFDLHLDISDREILAAIYDAAAMARVTQRIPLLPHVRARLDRLNIVRAVRGTTGIEGSDLTQEEVEKVIRAPEGTRVLLPARRREELETRNAWKVMQFVSETLERTPDRPVSEELICELHRMTTDSIPYENNEPGKYRSHGVSVGEYSPPKGHDLLRQLMAEFAQWLNAPTVRSWHPVVRAVAAHFYLISIHPFGDGNGRTARAVESYLLYQGNVNQRGFYSLANFYYRERARYFELLDYTRFESGGDLTNFVRFSAQGLRAELELIQDEVLTANREVAFHDYAAETIRGIESLRGPTRERLQVLLDVLKTAGSITPAQFKPGGVFAALYPAGPRALTRDIELLKQHRVLTEDSGELRPNLEMMDDFTRPVFSARV